MERGILRRELSRFREFADGSINGFQATEVIWEYAKYYKLLDFLISLNVEGRECLGKEFWICFVSRTRTYGR